MQHMIPILILSILSSPRSASREALPMSLHSTKQDLWSWQLQLTEQAQYMGWLLFFNLSKYNLDELQPMIHQATRVNCILSLQHSQ